MKKKFLSVAFFATLLFAGTSFVSCDDDDDNNGNPNGNAVIEIENVTRMKDFNQSGTFRGDGPNGVILPGQSVSFKFYAGKGQALAFATMYGYSNDLFFAPENPGLSLFDSDGNARTGDVSNQLSIWDNGTRVNQAPGANVEHPGTAEAANVTAVPQRDAQGHTYLAASDLMKAELTYNSATSEFTITIRNTSGGTMNETPFSPGLWAVSNVLDGNLTAGSPFFTPGQKSSTEMTALAEMGNPTSLYEKVSDNTGIITGLSPAIVVIYSGDTNPIYQLNQRDGGIGLKELAQKGETQKLKEALERLRNVDQVYVIGNDPVAPTKKIEGGFVAREGYNITFATMFGYSNDWFYSTNTIVTSTTKGDITGRVSLLDNGTGVSQYPGAGNAQALFGGTPVSESQNITTVGTTIFPVPAVSEIIKVTLR